MARIKISKNGQEYELWDADGDTGIQVEETADDDTIRFDAGGNEDVLKITSTEVTVNDDADSTVSFRVEGETLEHLLFASEDVVAVNTDELTFSVGGGTIRPVLVVKRGGGSAQTHLVLYSEDEDAQQGAFCDFMRKKKSGTGTIANGDRVGIWRALGHDGTSFVGTTNIQFSADAAVSTGVVPVDVKIQTGNGGAANPVFTAKSDGRVGLRTNAPTADIEMEGSVVINQSGADENVRIEGLGTAFLFQTDGGVNAVRIGDTVAGSVADFRQSVITFNETGEDQNLRVESLNYPRMLFMDAGNDRINIGTSADGTIAKFENSGVVFNEEGADRDLRVETDNQINALFIDGGNDCIGLFTANPPAMFGVGGSRAVKVDELNAATLTLDDTHEFISVTYTATGTAAITLPSAASSFNNIQGIGRTYTIADTGANAATNNITINRAGADTITDTTTGNTSVSIIGNGDVIRLVAISTTTWKVY